MSLVFLRPLNERPVALNFAQVLLCFIAFAAPLFIWPTAQEAYLIPKEALLQSLTFLLLALVLAASVFGQLLRIPLHPVNGLFALYVLWQGVSILWSESRALAIDEFNASLLLLLFLILFQSIVIGDRRRIVLLGWIFVATSVVVSIWALFFDFSAAFQPQSLAVRQTLGDWRDFVSAAAFGNTGHIADFIVLGFLISLSFFLTTWSRKARWTAMISLWIQSAALIVSWSVHSNGSLIVGAVLLFFLLGPKGEDRMMRRSFKQFAPLAAGWLLVVLFFVVDHPINPHGSGVWAKQERAGETGGIFAQAFGSDRWKEGGPTRLAIWLTTLEIVSDHPVLGAGAGNFTYVYPATTSELVLEDPSLAPYSASWTNAAHNTILQTWSETGIIGLALLISTFSAAFYFMVQRRRESSSGNAIILSTGISMLAAYCLQAQMNFPLELPVSTYVLLCLLSLPLVLPQGGRERDLLMPVWRDAGPLRIGIMLKNMRLPTEIQTGLSFSSRAAAPVYLVLFVLFTYPMWRQLDEVRASVLFRPVYEMGRDPQTISSPTLTEKAIEGAYETLNVDPSFVDCRSALSDILVRSGRFEEAVEQCYFVRRRLNAIEVYTRLGTALDALGREQEAMEAWDVVFSRRAWLGSQFPGPFRRWATKQRELPNDRELPEVE